MLRRATAVASLLTVAAATSCGGGGGELPRAARLDPGAKPQRFPRPSDVGVPAHWRPAQTRTTDLIVRRPGAVVHDIRFIGADLLVEAPNVTVRRVDMQGGRIVNWKGSSCQNGLLVEDSSFGPPPGQRYAIASEGATGVGGYTARRVKIWQREEGFRDGGKSDGCGPVVIEDSFAKIAVPPGCPGDPHSDGIQGYDGPSLTVRNVTIDFNQAACGTAPFFVPAAQGNSRVTVDRLLVMGGGEPFRLGVPGSVRGLAIVDRTWDYAPVDVRCSLVSDWNARVVRMTRGYRIKKTVRPQSCR